MKNYTLQWGFRLEDLRPQLICWYWAPTTLAYHASVND